MTHLKHLNFLIDRAKAIAGTDAEIARRLGVPATHISMWRSGKKVAQPEDQALLAEMAGLDPAQTLIRATVEYWEGKPKGDLLMRALGKASRVTGAALGFVGAGALGIFSALPSFSGMQCADRKQRSVKSRPLLAR